MRRQPAVAGQFYPLEKKELIKEIKKCFAQSGEPADSKKTNKIKAAIAPHAGYEYSGTAAAYTYKAIKEDQEPETIFIIGPNHTGMGPEISIYPHGEWETPLGNVPINEKKAEQLQNELFTLDEEAHFQEHSVEVQLPFLQYVYKHDFDIVPICVADQSKRTMEKLGKKLSEILNPKKHLLIISTDFSHYVPYEQAYKNDLQAINSITKLNTNELYSTVEKLGVSACGYGGIAAAIEYSKAKESKKGELLKYMTSGDVTGEKDQVVGYASIILK